MRVAHRPSYIARNTPSVLNYRRLRARFFSKQQNPCPDGRPAPGNHDWPASTKTKRTMRGNAGSPSPETAAAFQAHRNRAPRFEDAWYDRYGTAVRGTLSPTIAFPTEGGFSTTVRNYPTSTVVAVESYPTIVPFKTAFFIKYTDHEIEYRRKRTTIVKGRGLGEAETCS